MKDPETALMEKEFLEEDVYGQNDQDSAPGLINNNKNQDPTKNVKKLMIIPKKIATFIKKPKIVTLAILFMLPIVVILALSLLSQKNEREIATSPNYQIANPSPQTSVDPKRSELKKQIEQFNKNLQNLDSAFSDLDAPRVDLNIEF